MIRYALLAIALTLSTTQAQARIVAYEFDTPAQEQLFKDLSNELRCLVCQNQNIADSNAELAQDLRSKVYTMIKEGQTEDQIVGFMVDRYGDFVLYNPPVKPTTYILWFSPLLLIALGLTLLIRFIRGRNRQPEAPLSEAEHERLQAILKESDKQ